MHSFFLLLTALGLSRSRLHTADLSGVQLQGLLQCGLLGERLWRSQRSFLRRNLSREKKQHNVRDRDCTYMYMCTCFNER